MGRGPRGLDARVSSTDDNDVETLVHWNPAHLLRVLGLEPKTYGLKGRCSTTELRPPKRMNPIVISKWGMQKDQLLGSLLETQNMARFGAIAVVFSSCSIPP